MILVFQDWWPWRSHRVCKFGIGVKEVSWKPSNAPISLISISIRSGQNDSDVFRHLPKGQATKLSHLVVPWKWSYRNLANSGTFLIDHTKWPQKTHDCIWLWKNSFQFWPQVLKHLQAGDSEVGPSLHEAIAFGIYSVTGRCSKRTLL